MSPRTPVPERIDVQAYQVGFGDCVLLSFAYGRALDDGRDARHLLFDFGSTNWPREHKLRYRHVAADIAARTGGKLDVLVVTHRHKDHVSGFADDTAAATIASLQPSLVLRPWTEDPKARGDATAPAGIDASSRAFAQSLDAAQDFAAETARQLDGRRGFRGRLAHLADEQVPNLEAVERLDALARGDRGRYLFAGQPSGIEALVPGVTAHVLGPPTVKQWPRVAEQREDDPQYWLQHGRTLDHMLRRVAEPPQTRRAPGTPGPARWLVEQLAEQQVHSLLRITRAFDEALNNTSVVLLLKVGGRTLLFPGDAQIENWSYALEHRSMASVRRLLGGVDLYKVGHHGSRNATPRSLVELWRRRRRHVVSVMSTLPGVHGESDETAVPRTTLCDALEGLGALHRTDVLAPGELFLDVGAEVDSRDPFAPR